MKIIGLFVATILIFSCHKPKKSDPVPPAVNPQGELLGAQPSLRLVKVISRDSNNVYQSMKIEYDNKFRLTSVIDELSNRPFFQITYAGDTMISFTTANDTASLTKTYPLKISESGRRMELTTLAFGFPAGVDTIIQSVLFSNDRLIEFRKIRRSSNDGDSYELQKYLSYNGDGNVSSIQEFLQGNLSRSYTFNAHDNKRNFFAEGSKLLFLFEMFAPLMSSSVNNGTMITSSAGTLNITHTYTLSGYVVARRDRRESTWREFQYEF